MSKAKQDETEPTPPAPKEEEVIRVKLKRKTRKVVLESENGDETVCTLKEMSGSQRDDFLTSNAERVRVDSKGNPTGLRSFKGVFSNLIYRCLFDGNDRAVPQNAIDNWPASQQVEVFEACQEMNGLQDRKANEDASKND